MCGDPKMVLMLLQPAGPDLSLVLRPLYARGARFLPRRNKGLVSTVLRMCQFKTNEYTQTTLVGVKLLRVTFYV